jgi:hypothetical protein
MTDKKIFKVDVDLHTAIKTEAANRCMTINDYIRKLYETRQDNKKAGRK